MRVKLTRRKITLVAERVSGGEYSVDAYQTDVVENLAPLRWKRRTLKIGELFDQLNDLFDEAEKASD